MNSIPCDIVILPAGELAHKAIQLSGELAQHGTLFTLKDGDYFPHASLYMTQLKTADLDRVRVILADIAANTPLLGLTATRYDQAERFIDVDYARTKILDQLQMAVIEAINPIRDGMREKDKARMPTTTGKVRENLEQYGYRGVGDLFRPHMTLTRFAEEKPIDVSTLPNPHEFSGQFVKLGLFEMGDNGTCVRKIAAYSFGGRA